MENIGSEHCSKYLPTHIEPPNLNPTNFANPTSFTIRCSCSPPVASAISTASGTSRATESWYKAPVDDSVAISASSVTKASFLAGASGSPWGPVAGRRQAGVP